MRFRARRCRCSAIALGVVGAAPFIRSGNRVVRITCADTQVASWIARSSGSYPGTCDFSFCRNAFARNTCTCSCASVARNACSWRRELQPTRTLRKQTAPAGDDTASCFLKTPFQPARRCPGQQQPAAEGSFLRLAEEHWWDRGSNESSIKKQSRHSLKAQYTIEQILRSHGHAAPY